MAEAQREGGVYKVGAGDAAKWVDANGKEVAAPSKSEAKAEDERKAAPAVAPAPGAYPYAEVLTAGGFKDWAAVNKATDEQLLALDGIGPARLKEIREFKG